jgi:deazaflavin-dependent oxidoreductase (nitroreductase family)
VSESSGPSGWNQKIIDEFRANAGKVGGYFDGAPMILIHHIGARSGTERVNPLVYLPDGDDMIITATKGGAPTNPDWYHNLKAHPRTTVEVGTATFPVEATETTGDERSSLWRRLVEMRSRVCRVRDQDVAHLSNVQVDATLISAPKATQIDLRGLIFADGIAGITDASTTRRFGMARSRQYWSTTAIGCRTGPIPGMPASDRPLDSNG